MLWWLLPLFRLPSPSLLGCRCPTHMPLPMITALRRRSFPALTIASSGAIVLIVAVGPGSAMTRTVSVMAILTLIIAVAAATST